MGIGIPCCSPLKGGRPYSTEVVPRLAPMSVALLAPLRPSVVALCFGSVYFVAVFLIHNRSAYQGARFFRLAFAYLCACYFGACILAPR